MPRGACATRASGSSSPRGYAAAAAASTTRASWRGASISKRARPSTRRTTKRDRRPADREARRAAPPARVERRDEVRSASGSAADAGIEPQDPAPRLAGARPIVRALADEADDPRRDDSATRRRRRPRARARPGRARPRGAGRARLDHGGPTRGQERRRVGRHAADVQGEMEMRTGGVAGHPDRADRLPRAHRLAHGHEERRLQVAIEGDGIAAVVDLDDDRAVVSRPAKTTWPAANARTGVPIGAARSIPVWKWA